MHFSMVAAPMAASRSDSVLNFGSGGKGSSPLEVQLKTELLPLRLTAGRLILTQEIAVRILEGHPRLSGYSVVEAWRAWTLPAGVRFTLP